MACQLILKHLQIRHAVACPYNIVRFGVLQHPPYKFDGVYYMIPEFCSTLTCVFQRISATLPTYFYTMAMD